MQLEPHDGPLAEDPSSKSLAKMHHRHPLGMGGPPQPQNDPTSRCCSLFPGLLYQSLEFSTTPAVLDLRAAHVA